LNSQELRHCCDAYRLERSTKVLAILHIGYFGLFLNAAVLRSFELLGENIGVLGFVGIGF
jgi:hypothetical protein